MQKPPAETPPPNADTMQAAVEVLARALTAPFGKPPMDDDYAEARAILAEIAPMIVANSDRIRAEHAKLYASRGTE